MKPKLRQLVPVFVAPCALLSLLGFITPLALLPALSWIALSLFAGAMIGHKSSLTGVSRYLVGLPAMTMHFAWSLGFCQQLSLQLLGRSKALGKEPKEKGGNK
ncbi:hypothetical protein JCM19233_2903 [Vibrio astriarenae]|nr:hypothetical protein JCM19233_2903 [Vibrio sp. C7]